MKDPGDQSCPSCGGKVVVRLEPGEVCPQCESAGAWEEYGLTGAKLTVDAEAIRSAEARRRGLDDRPSIVSAKGFLPAIGSLALGLAGIWALLRFNQPREIGPLDRIRDELLADAWPAALAGSAAFVLGLVAVILLRRGRLFRSWPLLGVSLIGLALGAVSGAIGGLSWYAAREGFGWTHRSNPAGIEELSPGSRSVADATVVILAPDADGDARGMAIGAGAIVYADEGRAWVVTCSHVAMPYAAVAARRRAEDAHPVWVYFSDGRDAIGHVRWTAEPPLDVAVVSIEIIDPPAPIAVSRFAESVVPGTEVTFVPNPFRDGWMSHEGSVTMRRAHETPAGRFSLLHSDLPLQPGDSGSGIFGPDGKLVGINTWTKAGMEGPTGISLPSEAMGKILSLIEEGALDRLPAEEEDR